MIKTTVQGIRPQDIVILLKMVSYGDKPWMMKDIAQDLGISASEVSEAFKRNVVAGLISSDKKVLMKQTFLEFLRYGLPVTFPEEPGTIVRGLPTAHSAPPLNEHIQSSNFFVWPYAEGKSRGQAIVPLIASVPAACERDKRFYELMSLTEALRVGKAREVELAYEELKRRI